MLSDDGLVPGAKGDPGRGVRTPVVSAIVYSETLLELLLATVKKSSIPLISLPARASAAICSTIWPVLSKGFLACALSATISMPDLTSIAPSARASTAHGAVGTAPAGKTRVGADYITIVSA